MKVFEDIGYFCIDNLPATLIPKFADLCRQSDGKINKAALVIDVRGGLFLDDLSAALTGLVEMGIHYRILFFEANDEVLIQRFKETRRNHPLATDSTISDGLARERAILSELRGQADAVIDTSRLRTQDLRRLLESEWSDSSGFTVSLVSFGYKYGVPSDVDLLIDVRFLPNPYYIPALRERTGLEKEVRDYVLDNEISAEFIRRYSELLDFLLPQYVCEGKRHLTIGVGCTGGQHRSVTIAIFLGELLREKKYTVNVNHRDL